MPSVAVVGLSSFGFYLCQSLAELGVETLAVDINEQKIDKVKKFIEQAVVGDATNKQTLEQVSIKEYDKVVVSMGDDIELSILVTLHLKELGIKEIYAKAATEDHAKILGMVGAQSTVFPERDMAARFAQALSRNNVIDFLPLSDKYSIIQLTVPEEWEGEKLSDLNIEDEYKIRLIMIKNVVPEEEVVFPEGDYVLKDSDILVLAGPNDLLEKVQNL